MNSSSRKAYETRGYLPKARAVPQILRTFSLCLGSGVQRATLPLQGRRYSGRDKAERVRGKCKSARRRYGNGRVQAGYTVSVMECSDSSVELIVGYYLPGRAISMAPMSSDQKSPSARSTSSVVDTLSGIR